jgi:phenylalanyl-tRNA synthetase beta chain
MLAMLAYNLNRDVREVRLFEKGTVFTGCTAEVREFQSLALGLTGTSRATALHNAKDAGIFELKGAIESLLSLFAASPDELSSSASAAVTFSTRTPAWIEPGRGAVASLNGREIAWFGELATAEREARKLRQPVYLAEIDVEALFALPLRRVTAHEISRYQAVERDFSFTFADAVHWDAIEQAVKSLNIAELVRLAPVEIFRDAKAVTVPAGHHALLLRCVFQSPDRTLREEELSRWSAQVIDALTKLGGVLRA